MEYGPKFSVGQPVRYVGRLEPWIVRSCYLHTYSNHDVTWLYEIENRRGELQRQPELNLGAIHWDNDEMKVIFRIVDDEFIARHKGKKSKELLPDK